MESVSRSDEIYIISYLLRSTEDNQVVGYADLAARVYYLTEKIRDDEKVPNAIAEDLDSLVEKTKDGMIKWDSLRSFVESARVHDVGSMFLAVESEETGPNKWEYKFSSNAPETVLITKIETFSDQSEGLKQKIENTAKKDKRELYKTIF